MWAPHCRAVCCWLHSGPLHELVCIHQASECSAQQLEACCCLFLGPSRDTAAGVHTSCCLMPLIITNGCSQMLICVRQWLHLLPRGIPQGDVTKHQPWDSPLRFWLSRSGCSAAAASTFKGSMGSSSLQPRLSGIGRCRVETVCIVEVKVWVSHKELKKSCAGMCTKFLLALS